MSDEPALTMSFDPNTIEHLGVRMYSTLPPVLAELVANSYDADATKVSVRLKDDDQKEIIVEDDGNGMSQDDINDKFLRIGRDRRTEEHSQTTLGGRLVIGKKGLGKLSFFGIAKEIEISTRKDGKETAFLMRWDDIKAADRSYSPTPIKLDEPCDADKHGTTITLRQIDRASDFSAEDLANSLSKIFIIPDSGFKVEIGRNSDAPIAVDNDRKFLEIEAEFKWKVPQELSGDPAYAHKDDIKGLVIASKKPISPKTNMRGIVLYSRTKLVNAPEYFSDSASSHFFSYLTGWLEVDFIDELDEDVISTDRKSLKWDHPEMVKLREYLQSLIRRAEQDWRKRRSQAREEKLNDATGINVPEWLSKVPEEVKSKITPIVEAIVHDSELPEDTTNAAVKLVHDIVPEYPRYHWRHLHPEIKAISKRYYEDQDYYTAFLEAAKRYANAVRTKSGSTISDDAPMMENVFNMNNPVLSVTDNFKKPDGTDFRDETIKNIKNAHVRFSGGVVLGGRNVVAHEEVRDLKESGLFTEDDCLDALSLLSHLYHRLDNSQATASTTAAAPASAPSTS